MNGLQIPRWIIPVAGFAAAVWAVAMWWMVASLPAAGASEAELDLIVAHAEIDRLQISVDELSQQITALQQQRSEFTLRLDALEDGTAMVGVPAPAPAAQPARMAGPEPEATEAAEGDADMASNPEDLTTPATTEPIPTPTATASPTPEPEPFIEPVATPPSVEYYTDGRDLYSCRDFDSWEEAQQVYEANLPGDPNKIDIDRNGIACEALRD